MSRVEENQKKGVGERGGGNEREKLKKPQIL